MYWSWVQFSGCVEMKVSQAHNSRKDGYAPDGINLKDNKACFSRRNTLKKSDLQGLSRNGPEKLKLCTCLFVNLSYVVVCHKFLYPLFFCRQSMFLMLRLIQG